MPLEYCAIPLDDIHRKECGHEVIEPEDVGHMLEDFSTGEKQIIGMKVDINEVGLVEVFPCVGALAEDPDEIDLDDMPDAISRVKVYEGRPHTQEYTTADGVKTDLIARIVAPNAITAAGHIPMGLCFPDRPVNFDGPVVIEIAD